MSRTDEQGIREVDFLPSEVRDEDVLPSLACMQDDPLRLRFAGCLACLIGTSVGQGSSTARYEGEPLRSGNEAVGRAKGAHMMIYPP